MESKGQERISFSRAVFPCKIAVGSHIRWMPSHAEDLSAGGIKVILEEKLSVYTPVSIELFFEKDKSIKCKGKIAWVEEEVNPLEMEIKPIIFVTGIEFTEISDSDKEYIRKLVKVLSLREKK
jgi:hypothetical protein